MKRIKKYLGGSYFRLPSLSSEFQTGASLKVPYINTLLQQYITNTGNFSAPIPTSSKVKDNTLKDTVSNIGSSIIGKASDAVSDKIFGDSELGRNLGTIFSSGLNSVGDTVLNNAIKKAALTDGLTKNLGSSVGGAVAGLGANYLGRGITSILGNNAASRFLGLSASTVGGTIGGKILSSGTKNLFSGPGSINPIGLGMSAVGAGLSAATGPSKEYNGTYGSTTKALDTVYDALLAGINFVPGWGLIASGAMALNKGLSNIFGSTDGMTSTDAILGSAFMPAPIKWLNMLGSSKTGTFNKLSWLNTLKTSNFMQNAFGDLEDKFSKAREEAGKTYGTFSQGAKKRALNNIDFSNFAWNKILNMADLNEYQNIRSSDMASINNLRYALWILGGFSPLARGKLGMKILNNSINHNLGLRLLSGAALIDNKQMILSALNGTKIKKKGIKSGINVDYYDPNNVMSVVANNPNKTIVLDELTVRPYNKLPMQSKLFQGITNQAANEKADEYVNRVTPTAEDLFNIGTLGGLNNLSPTQWVRRAYDLRKAIKGNMSWDKFGNNWFYGNNGLISDKYVQEHPYASAAINLAGDIGAFGTFSALRKLPKYATLMEAENRAAQEATALNWRDMLSNNVKRTRIGDVEIDNPNLLYHLDRGNSAGMFSNQGAYVEDGILFPGVAKKEGQLGYSWWNKGKPYTTSVKGQPMTRLMTATKDAPGMLQVRSQNYPIGQWTGSKGFVLPSEYVNPEGVNVSESIYALEPTYGWRRVSENTPTLNWADATRTPRITAENATSVTPKQWTAAQDAAIARGDMKEARRLKKLYDKVSAKKANRSLYSNLRHDTNSDIWNVFDESKFGSATDDGWFGKGLYLTANPKQIVKGNNHMRLNVFMKKPFLVNKNGDPDRWTVAREFNRGKTYDDWIKKNSFSENEIEDFFSGFKDNPFGVSESKEAIHLKKDIVRENKLRKLFDEMNSSDGVIVSTPKVNLDEVVAPNGRFIKSADVVTYDDNGVRIGLGERNNFSINDNRYGWQGNRYVLDLTTLEGILNFIDNDIIPRMLAQGHDVSSYTPIFRQFSPKTDAFDEAMSKANSGSGAWFTPASNDITIRGPLEKQDFGLTIHEAGGHGLRYNMLPDYVPTKREYLNEYIITGGRDMSDEAANALLKMHTGDQIYNIIEAQKLRESYPWIKTYFERNPVKKSGDTVLRESGSVNTQFRSHYSNSGKIVGKELDKAIDEASPGVVLRDLIEQPYTSSIIDDIGKITGKDPDVLLFYGPEMLEKLVNLYPELLKIVSKVKDTMKTVGSYGVPVTIGGSTAATLYNKSK